jgi:Tfp pilus assembly protein PilF
MWSRASTDGVGRAPHASTLCRAIGGMARGRSVLEPAVVLAITTMLLAGCESAPPVSQPAGAAASASGAGQSGSAAPGAGGAPNIAVTPRGKADFDRAVGFMRAGNTTEAELEFKQVALQFPQLSAPYVNLGILYRKTGRLEQSEQALKTAVERNDGSAVAWTELGATQRLRGEFPNAAASYEKAIVADPNFAPAYRNLGVVSDLYLGDPERALTAFERYKELTGEEKPVSGWIAELRQRTGKPPLKRPSAAPASGSSDAAPGAPPGPSAAAPGTSDAPGAAAPGAATPATPQAVPGASQSGKPAEPRGGQPPAAAAPSPQAGD